MEKMHCSFLQFKFVKMNGLTLQIVVPAFKGQLLFNFDWKIITFKEDSGWNYKRNISIRIT